MNELVMGVFHQTILKVSEFNVLVVNLVSERLTVGLVVRV